MRNETVVVRAAGALLWRPSRKHGIRIALVRRPRYGDWSLPKGKAEPGESAQVTAAREVWEETGFRVALGRALTTVTYAVSTGPKSVRYFAARSLDGTFVPNKEVDRLEWLSPTAARSRMSYDFDRAVLDAFLAEPAQLRTIVLVRHARAGHRESYHGDDSSRPLDAKGRKQADALVDEILPFAPDAIHSAPLERCRATVSPLAQKLGATVVPEPTLAEDAYRDDPAAARHRLVELAAEMIFSSNGSVPSAQLSAAVTGKLAPTRSPASGRARPGDAPIALSGCVVACSQGGVIPGVVKSLAGRSDVSVPTVGTPKAAFWVLSFDDRRLVQADPFPAPTV